MDIFNHCPGNGQSIIGTGTAPNLIQDQQAARSGMVQDVGCFNHLHHKGGLTGVNFILGADACKNPIDQSDAGRGGRHITANLRHQDNQSHLAQEGGLAAHIRTGNDADNFTRFKGGIVWDKTFTGKHLFHHGMTSIADFQDRVSGNFRTSIPSVGSRFCQGCQNVQFCKGTGCGKKGTTGCC